MPGRKADPLALVVAVAILALAFYVATLPATVLVVPAGTSFNLTDSKGLEFNFTVVGNGGRLVGAYASSAAMSPWIHPASTAGVLPRGPLNPPCGAGFNLILPPDSYLLTLFGGPAVVRITEAIRVIPANAPAGSSGFATFSNATACPLPAG